jgi:hypothetical protein
MVTLDDTLESDLENRTELLLDWHRTTQLEQYAAWLRELQDDINPELDDERLKYHEKKLETYWTSISSRLNSDMAELLPRLSPEQVTELFASLKDKNEDFREDYIDIDDSERRENYIETITDIYKDWLDTLDEAQLTDIEQAASDLKSSATRRLELRLLWQSQIHDILVADHTRIKKQNLLNEYFTRYDMNSDPALKIVNEANKSVLRKLTKNIVHSMNPEQKKYFKQRTDDYIKMFEELARYE